MTAREVEEIVAHARALVEAHERRFPGTPYATTSEAQSIELIAQRILAASEAEAARRQAA